VHLDPGSQRRSRERRTAQSPAELYKGKTIDLYVGYSAGGGYDVYARSLARHMSRFVPGNPTGRAEEHAGCRQSPARQLAL
jgi:hypothetical protein